ncbi:RING finger protein 39-like [Anguilla anguilla]|uniref:RING finger protein 39-like n=1 Tax=Anguilla anguilla TaxID=7936 RepID=UPI0015AB2BA4|nr:RING finger protein 39-like [Anguilla anguilla]
MKSQMQGRDWTTAESTEMWDVLEEPSSCPSCGREFDVPLLLPCSHTLCGSCVEAAAGGSSGAPSSGAPSSSTAPGQAAGAPVCALPCPCCHLPVELPCWDWASATRCLPLNPTLARRPGAIETEEDQDGGRRQGAGRKNESEEETLGKQKDPKTCLQAEPCCVDAHALLRQATLNEYADWPQGGTVDLHEEEMEQSVRGLVFSLDPSTAAPPLLLSGSALTVTFQGQDPPAQAAGAAGLPVALERQDPSPLPQVCAALTITRGQFYWEVDVCNSACYRIGVSSVDTARGWWLERRGGSFSAVFDGRREPLPAVPPQIKTVGVFLNMGGGALSFHNALTQEHLATLPSRFGLGVCPALGLGQGRLRLRCGLPPPPHVFLCRSSAYRCPAGAGAGRWRRDVRFHSIRTFIQKFEELSAAESDSGLVSSFGSCSTLASLPDPGP